MDQAINGKAIKFRAFAERRVTTVIKAIRRVGNLSRRATYDHHPDQVAKMFKAIRDELDAAELKFSPPEKDSQFPLFKLD